MAYTTINKSTDNFNTVTYTGNGSTNAITGVGFQPDFTWIKRRDGGTTSHQLFDAVRGVTKRLYSNTTDAENTNATTLTAFGTDGFTVGSNTGVNPNGNGVVAWNWKAGTGAGSANTDGSINTTYTSVNTTAGFSISKYTGNGTTGATVGHGLGAIPKWIIVKRLDSATTNFQVYHSSMGAEKYIQLNTTSGQSDSDVLWNDTAPTNQVFSLGNYSHVNYNGSPHIAYCFAEKTGYSKFGSYTGNGNADGTFVYTGFKPAFIMQKKTSGTSDWVIYDNKRDTSNVVTQELKPNSNAAESSNTNIDILSNGFKQRANYAYTNNSGATYIYIAFAEAPLVGSNNVPCTAR